MEVRSGGGDRYGASRYPVPSTGAVHGGSSTELLGLLCGYWLNLIMRYFLANSWPFSWSHSGTCCPNRWIRGKQCSRRFAWIANVVYAVSVYCGVSDPWFFAVRGILIRAAHDSSSISNCWRAAGFRLLAWPWLRTVMSQLSCVLIVLSVCSCCRRRLGAASVCYFRQLPAFSSAVLSALI